MNNNSLFKTRASSQMHPPPSKMPYYSNHGLPYSYITYIKIHLDMHQAAFIRTVLALHPQVVLADGHLNETVRVKTTTTTNQNKKKQQQDPHLMREQAVGQRTRGLAAAQTTQHPAIK